MAICVEFELIEITGTKAKYKFGPCLKELDGIFELDLFELTSGAIPESTPINEVVRLINDKQSQLEANRAFSKIYKHFMEHNEYMNKGGFYA
jgi:hypothetical protein